MCFSVSGDPTRGSTYRHKLVFPGIACLFCCFATVLATWGPNVCFCCPEIRLKIAFFIFWRPDLVSPPLLPGSKLCLPFSGDPIGAAPEIRLKLVFLNFWRPDSYSSTQPWRPDSWPECVVCPACVFRVGTKNAPSFFRSHLGSRTRGPGTARAVHP